MSREPRTATEDVPSTAEENKQNVGVADSDTPVDDPEDSSVDSGANTAAARAQRELLIAENERLREEYNRIQQSQYRLTAVGLAAVGVVAGVSGFVYPSVADTALVLAAIGAFGGILTYYLTPERFITSSIGRQMSEVHTDHVESLVAELGLSGKQVYDPRPEAAQCRLFLPSGGNDTYPDPAALSDTFVVSTDGTTRGISLVPIGAKIYAEFVAAAGTPPTKPTEVASAVGEALVESFELADTVRVTADSPDGRVTADVAGSLFGNDPSVEDPIVSTLAVAVAARVEEPVTVDTTKTDDGYTVSCYWTDDGDDTK